MAQVNITQAAKLAGISRSYFHRKYIKQGLISVTSDEDGNKQIDTSELLRVFGKLKDSQVHSDDRENYDTAVHTIGSKEPDYSADIELLKTQLAVSEVQIRELQNDKEWLQSQVTNLTDSIKLLEAPKHHRQWWKFWK